MKKLTTILFFTFVLLHLSYLSVASGQNDNRKGIEFFESRIRPVLVGQCYRCHSKESNKTRGGLRVDTRSALLKGGDSGPAVVPGQPEKSPLYTVLTYEGEYQMPPSGQLDQSLIADLKKWIEMGAPDPRDPNKKERIVEVNSLIDIEAGRSYWAYQSPVHPEIPATTIDDWSRTELDRFVHERLVRNGLKPNGDAKPEVLVRRLFFVLTGLPPSPTELELWSGRLSGIDQINQAEVEKLVDQLLDSDQFGEHWGRHWMDVARFGESTGGDNNNIYPHAWRYRNYVIDAFNKDKPFDRFILEQLAGDLLPIENDEEWAENLIATGFLAMGVKLVGEEDQRKFMADLVDDQIDTTTRAFLATTVSCARCHDHKFDPIPQTDYYALAGIFRSTETHYGLIKAQARQHAKLIDVTELGVPSSKPKLSTSQFAALKKDRDDAHAKMDELMKNIRGGNAPTRNILRLSRTRRDKSEAALQSYDDRGNPRVFVMGTQDHEFPAENFLLVRGDINKPAQRVGRGFVSVLTPRRFSRFSRNVRGSGRLELAEWIADEDNPLTARVMSNRIWHWVFGQGIVRTVDDFGTTGEQAVNLELLDYLAIRFVGHRWKIKSLIKELVMSRTWQLSSDFNEQNFVIDPDNRFCWRANPRRLEAESIRDSMLAVSGNLDLKRPSGSYVARVGEGSVGLSVFEPEIRKIEEPVRSVYLPRVRNVLPEMLELFDAPDAGLVMGSREKTNTPLQALYILNNPFSIEQAEAFAKQVLEKPSRSRLQFAYLAAFGRQPTDREARLAKQFLEQNKHLGIQKAMLAYCQALICSAEFITIN